MQRCTGWAEGWWACSWGEKGHQIKKGAGQRKED